MNQALLTVYLAAGMSFGAGVVRDWLVVQQIATSKEFFGAMYAIAFSSSFAVNVMSFRPGHRPLSVQDAKVIAASTLLCLAILWASGSRDLGVMLICVPMPALYVVGASYSRRLLDQGTLFLSRSRDGLTSLLMSILIVVGLGVEALLAATLIATALFSLLVRRGIGGLPEPAGEAGAPAPSHWLWTVVYSNLAISLVTLWALYVNNHGSDAWGHPAPVVVRVSMYVFQILSIPAVLVVRLRVPHRHTGALRTGVWVGVLAMLGAAMLPLAVACIALPMCAIATLYLSLLHMRAEHLRSAPMP